MLNKTKLQTFIFLGRSGCGKGTQAELLADYLKRETGRETFHLETGEAMRQFIKGDSLSARQAKKIMDIGGLQPPFLAIYTWADLLIQNLRGDEHLIFDGVGRILLEAEALSTALEFYERTEPKVIYLDVSDDWARARLAGRGRPDDLKAEDVERRLAWFENNVKQSIAYYRNNSQYKFLQIDGEQAVEKVHQDIVASL